MSLRILKLLRYISGCLLGRHRYELYEQKNTCNRFGWHFSEWVYKKTKTVKNRVHSYR